MHFRFAKIKVRLGRALAGNARPRCIESFESHYPPLHRRVDRNEKISFVSHPLQSAFRKRWILPRPIKQSTGLFDTPVCALVPVFRIPSPTKTHIKKRVADATLFFMGWVMGFEPTNTGTTIRGLNRLATPTIFSLLNGFARKNGTPEGTRTPDLLLRRQLLYPAELLAHLLERVTGIGPAYPAWKAGVLPLNYTRKSTFRLADSAIGF